MNSVRLKEEVYFLKTRHYSVVNINDEAFEDFPIDLIRHK